MEVQQGRFRLGVRKTFFTERLGTGTRKREAGNWNFPRDVFTALGLLETTLSDTWSGFSFSFFCVCVVH